MRDEQYILLCKMRCLNEWENVNDPPCHPSDKGWAPCELCASDGGTGQHVRAKNPLLPPSLKQKADLAEESNAPPAAEKKVEHG